MNEYFDKLIAFVKGSTRCQWQLMFPWFGEEILGFGF